MRYRRRPSDGSVPFDKRTEFPEGQRVTNEVGRSRYRGRSGAAIYQGYLAEVLAAAERSEVDAFTRNAGFSGFDDEEGGAARALHDDGLALRKPTLLEQACDLLGLRRSILHASSRQTCSKREQWAWESIRHRRR